MESEWLSNLTGQLRIFCLNWLMLILIILDFFPLMFQRVISRVQPFFTLIRNNFVCLLTLMVRGCLAWKKIWWWWCKCRGMISHKDVCFWWHIFSTVFFCVSVDQKCSSNSQKIKKGKKTLTEQNNKHKPTNNLQQFICQINLEAFMGFSRLWNTKSRTKIFLRIKNTLIRH